MIGWLSFYKDLGESRVYGIPPTLPRMNSEHDDQPVGTSGYPIDKPTQKRKPRAHREAWILSIRMIPMTTTPLQVPQDPRFQDGQCGKLETGDVPPICGKFKKAYFDRFWVNHWIWEISLLDIAT